MKQGLILVPLLALLAGCGGSKSAPHGTLTLLVTDAPVPFELIRSATVDIDRISLDEGPTSMAAPRILYQGAPISVELMSLRNGVVRRLLKRQLPLLTYRRVHVHFSGAQLEVANGHMFSTADGTLQLPQDSKTGLDVTIETPISFATSATSGSARRLLLDIDLPRSLIPVGTPDILQADQVLLDPRFHAVKQGSTGEIRGIVQRLDTQGVLVPVGNTTLYFLPAGTQDLNMASASTSTDVDGSFVKLGLRPGSYDVLAQKSGLLMTYNACPVRIGDYSVVEIQLP